MQRLLTKHDIDVAGTSERLNHSSDTLEALSKLYVNPLDPATEASAASQFWITSAVVTDVSALYEPPEHVYSTLVA